MGQICSTDSAAPDLSSPRSSNLPPCEPPRSPSKHLSYDLVNITVKGASDLPKKKRKGGNTFCRIHVYAESPPPFDEGQHAHDPCVNAQPFSAPADQPAPGVLATLTTKKVGPAGKKDGKCAVEPTWNASRVFHLDQGAHPSCLVIEVFDACSRTRSELVGGAVCRLDWESLAVPAANHGDVALFSAWGELAGYVQVHVSLRKQQCLIGTEAEGQKWEDASGA